MIGCSVIEDYSAPIDRREVDDRRIDVGRASVDEFHAAVINRRSEGRPAHVDGFFGPVIDRDVGRSAPGIFVWVGGIV
jgi:hypothetical protein